MRSVAVGTLVTVAALGAAVNAEAAVPGTQ